METRAAVPAARAWPALLVDGVLLPALPVAMLFAVSAGWVLGPFVGALVIAVVLFIERGTSYPVRREIVGMATMLYVALALLAIEFGTAFSCSEPTHPSLAVLLALVVFFTVYSNLPGIPLDCSD